MRLCRARQPLAAGALPETGGGGWGVGRCLSKEGEQRDRLHSSPGQCGGMFKRSKHEINVWTSGLNLATDRWLGDEPLSFHIAGSVLQLQASTEFQRVGSGERRKPGQPSAHVGFSCCV